MNREIIKYLRSNCPAHPTKVDRLIISAFFWLNGFKVKKNDFLKCFIISEDSVDEFAKLIEFSSLLGGAYKTFGPEDLIELFEFVISPADRIVNGAIYTPLDIRKYIIKQSLSSKRDSFDTLKIADISCGCGGFIYTVAKELKRLTKKSYYEIFKNQLFGLDIQPYSITRTKLLLSVLAVSEGEDRKKFKFNLHIGDALDFNWPSVINKFSGFDIILGNPPYVCSRHLSVETKLKLSKLSVCNSGHPDLYIPFFHIGMESLAKDGVLGFITMNSFFKSLNGRGIREYFQKSSYKFRIIDFGTEQVFKSRYTYTCICIIQKTHNNYIQYLKSESSKLLPIDTKSFNAIEYSRLESKKGWNLEKNEIISKIESTGVSFGELYKTRNGIATLKNEIYIFSPIDEDKDHYYLQNGSVYKIEKEICRDIVNSNKLGKTGSLSKLMEKVIFPYNDNSKPQLLSESFLRKNFPKAYKYLENKKTILAGRDNGNANYEKWFAFGRTQSLEKVKHKLFFPHITDTIPNCIINSDEDLLFYNGLALLGQNRNELVVVKKLMESRLFWYYIQNTSKPYTSGYFSLSSIYIRHFGVCNLDKRETDFVVREQDSKALDRFFERKYGITL
jgi:adenine-specific DNA-methyltransferase